MARFISVYRNLPAKVHARLVIENDDRLFNLDDCFKVYEQVGIPIVFDYFHDRCLPSAQELPAAMAMAKKSWQKPDGILMVDYSSQQLNARRGKHNDTIDLVDFNDFLIHTQEFDFDIMLEIKDKEHSALLAIEWTYISGSINCMGVGSSRIKFTGCFSFSTSCFTKFSPNSSSTPIFARIFPVKNVF